MPEINNLILAISFILTKISQFSVIIPLVPACFYYKRFPTSFKLLAWYIFMCALTEPAAFIVKTFNDGNNAPVIHFFVPAEFLSFFFIFHTYLKNKKFSQYLMLVLLISVPVISLSDLYFKGPYQFNDYARATSGAAISIMSLFTLYSYFKMDEVQAHQEATLWLCTGTLIYFAPNIPTFMMMNDMIAYSKETFVLSKNIHALLNIIYYLFYTIAFLHFSKQTKRT